MGRRARRKQREHDLRKQPNDRKAPFVERKVRELFDMDLAIAALIEKGQQ